MARTSTGSPDEALAGMAKNGRKPMGTEGIKASAPSATDTGRAKLVKKQGAQAGDPTVMAKPSRKNVPVNRKGARYGIRVNTVAPQAPEAGYTQSNGRIIKSAINRSNDSFNAGVDLSY